jgi:hypothetical protein
MIDREFSFRCNGGHCQFCENYAEIQVDGSGGIWLYMEADDGLKGTEPISAQELSNELCDGLLRVEGVGEIDIGTDDEKALIAYLAERGITLPEPELEEDEIPA